MLGHLLDTEAKGFNSPSNAGSSVLVCMAPGVLRRNGPKATQTQCLGRYDIASSKTHPKLSKNPSLQGYLCQGDNSRLVITGHTLALTASSSQDTVQLQVGLSEECVWFRASPSPSCCRAWLAYPALHSEFSSPGRGFPSPRGLSLYNPDILVPLCLCLALSFLCSPLLSLSVSLLLFFLCVCFSLSLSLSPFMAAKSCFP